ncbi:MAG: type II toxin-antitoxin system VapC family toxin [Dehalococcoidia bacterium]|nr:type II toxin-antitoxin system VapC family toxin [Dehalococcoidia bacterium]
MIVVDTNVIGYLFLSSERSDQAEQVLVKDPHWAASLLWKSELRNVLATYVNRALLSLEDAVHIISEAEGLLKDSEYEIASDQVLRLAQQSRCSAYDCELVALAMALNVPLITVDKKVLAQFSAVSIDLNEFASS